jgi:putative ABC transport system substrate-binding protein
MARKRGAIDCALATLREVVPRLSRFAIMANAGNRVATPEMAEVEAIARRLGLETTTLPIRRAGDIAPAIAAIKGRADALYVCGDPLTATNQVLIHTLTVNAHLPTMHANSDFVIPGGLMSYGSNFPHLFRRGADYVDKILHGVSLPTSRSSSRPSSIWSST